MSIFSGCLLLTRIAVTAVLLLGILSMSVALADAKPAKRTLVVGTLGGNAPTTSEGARIWEGFALGLRDGGPHLGGPLVYLRPAGRPAPSLPR